MVFVCVVFVCLANIPEICYLISMTDDRIISVPAAYLNKLEQKVGGISALVEISAIISSTHQLDELMNLVMDRAKKEPGG